MGVDKVSWTRHDHEIFYTLDDLLRCITRACCENLGRHDAISDGHSILEEVEMVCAPVHPSKP